MTQRQMTQQQQQAYAEKLQQMRGQQQPTAAALMSYPVPRTAHLVVHERETDIGHGFGNATSVTMLNFGWIQILNNNNELLALFPIPNVRSIVFEYPTEDAEDVAGE